METITSPTRTPASSAGPPETMLRTRAPGPASASLVETPRKARSTRPSSARSRTTARTVFAGTAKPMPTLPRPAPPVSICELSLREAERVADRHREVADPDPLGVGEREGGQRGADVLRIEREDREVGRRVAPGHARVDATARAGSTVGAAARGLAAAGRAGGPSSSSSAPASPRATTATATTSPPITPPASAERRAEGFMSSPTVGPRSSARGKTAKRAPARRGRRAPTRRGRGAARGRRWRRPRAAARRGSAGRRARPPRWRPPAPRRR